MKLYVAWDVSLRQHAGEDPDFSPDQRSRRGFFVRTFVRNHRQAS